MRVEMSSLNLILHAHQPYVRHLEYERFLEEDWLYEALNETYIPLLRMLDRITSEHFSGVKLTLCFSPTLLSMLSDPALQERFLSYMERHLELGRKEIERTKNENSDCYLMAYRYYNETSENLRVYKSLKCDLISAFKNYEERGVVEIIGSAATHAFLPLYKDYPSAVNAEIEEGIEVHKKYFNKIPKGFWLPECGYYPGLDKILKKNGIEWIQLPSQAPLLSADRSLFGGYRPITLPSGVKAFSLDWGLTNLVWSDKTGYPCDGVYREFYRDIGYELPLDYVGPYMHEEGLRVFTGFKYYAITGKTDNKIFYDISKAEEKCTEHVKNFIFNLERKDEFLSSYGINDGVINIAFDAELFGHRWYEGIDFLEKLLLSLSTKESNITLSTPSEILKEKGKTEKLRINECSWNPRGGEDGYLEGGNRWVCRHTFNAIEKMEDLIRRFPSQGDLKDRFLTQASKELLLALSSDWQVMIHNNTSSSYAEKRLRGHLESFNVVYSSMCKNTANTEWLINAEKKTPLFDGIDYRIFDYND